MVPTRVAAGRITSWSHNAGPGAGQTLTLKTFSKPIWPNSWEVVEHDVPRAIAPGGLNTFSGLSIPIKAGDMVGLNDGAIANACTLEAPGELVWQRQGDLADGRNGIFGILANLRLNVTATIQPANTFTLRVASKNKRKGTASVAVTVPNPGQLTFARKDAKGAPVAAAALTAPVPGLVHMTVRAKGKKRKKLNDKGRATVKPTITYTPTDGTARSQSLKLRLRKKR